MFKFALNQTVYFMMGNRVQRDMIIGRFLNDYSDYEKAAKRVGNYLGKTEITYKLLGTNDNLAEKDLFSSEVDLFAFLGNNIIDKIV